MKKILFEIFLIIMLTVFLYHSVKYNMQTPEQTEIAHIEEVKTTSFVKGEVEVTQETETKTVLELYLEMVKRAEQLYAYHNAYRVLMEEGVNELLMTIGIAPDSYNYDFYQLCLDN